MPNQPSPEKGEQKAQTAKWKALVAKFQKPSCGRASWQLINSLGSYIALWVVIYFTLQISWWIVIPLAILAGGFVVRTFIIQHDCGHGSFLKSPKANEFWGRICGFATFTPYGHWRWEHSTHHATSGDLDRRGVGDIWTMTVEEFLAASRWKRFSYRLSRNPIILFVIAPVCSFRHWRSISGERGNRQGETFGLAKQPRSIGLCGGDVLDFWHRALSHHPAHDFHGGEFGWSMVVLRSAPI